MTTRILFVDQSALMQKMAGQAFSREKIEVIKVSNGDLATWLINQINPDMVIADVSLPDRNGYELCRYIKDDERLSHIPVVLLYWPDEKFDHAKANAARADAFLAKPFEPQKLVETAQRLLRKKDEARSPSVLPVAPPSNTESGFVESDEPLDLSGVFEQSDFDSYSRAADYDSEFPLAIEDSPAPPFLLNEPVVSADETHPLMMAAPATEKSPEPVLPAAAADRALRPRRRTRSRAMAVGLALLLLALIAGLWQATRVRETERVHSPVASIPQSGPQSQPDSAASADAPPVISPRKESTETERQDPPRLAADRRGDNPAAQVYMAKSVPNANRYELPRARNSNESHSTANRSPQQSPRPDQTSATTAKNSRIEQSPLRIIPSEPKATALPPDVKSGSAAQQQPETENGFKVIGGEVKNAVVWTGKKAGRGLKAVGRGLKRAFTHDPKLD